MQTDTETIKQHFRKSIHKYRENAVVQKFMAQELVKLLTIKKFNSVLEFGAGAGFLTEQFAKELDFEEYLANDLVEESEVFVKKYISNAEFLCGDLEKIQLEKHFDLLASNAVFQWVWDFDKLVQLCAGRLNPEGILLFSTFLPDNFKEIRQISGLTLEYCPEEKLKSTLGEKFDIVDSKKGQAVLTFDNPLKILAHLKNTGVNSLSKEIWSIKQMREFCEAYQKEFPNLQLTYSYILIAAKLKN